MLFPTLAASVFKPIDLDMAARRWFLRERVDPSLPNPLIDPTVCRSMVEEAQAEIGADASYGGWLEDRRALWHGTYLEDAGTFLHLGVDFNVPHGTPVALEEAGTVVLVDSDVPEEGGWGTRVIVRPEARSEVLVYAHLDPSVRCRAGERLPAGTVFAQVGRPPENGGWFPHLHVQRVVEAHFEELARQGLSALDGYGAASERDRLAGLFPDPLLAVFRERVPRGRAVAPLPVPGKVC